MGNSGLEVVYFLIEHASVRVSVGGKASIGDALKFQVPEGLREMVHGWLKSRPKYSIVM